MRCWRTNSLSTDGFSIGSNDMTQLTLGLDRDSGLIAHLFDERNEAVRHCWPWPSPPPARRASTWGSAARGRPITGLRRLAGRAGIDSVSLNPIPWSTPGSIWPSSTRPAKPSPL